jgi:tetratricopeptide (TPR) repeat protein
MVFLAVALADEEKYDQASVHLDSLDAVGAPLGILEVVLSQGLYGKVYGESRYLKIIEIEEPSLEDLQVNSEVALEIANYLLLSAKQERTVSAIKVFRAILMEQPYHPEALSREALLLAQTGNQLLYERAVELLNLAVENNPDNLEAVLSRVSVRAVVDQEGACEDLVTLDQLLDGGSQLFSEQILLQVDRIRAEVNCR